MIKELIKLANHLDSKGLAKEADSLDEIAKTLSKMAAKAPKTIEDLVDEWKSTIFSWRKDFGYTNPESPEEYEPYLFSEDEISGLISKYTEIIHIYEAAESKLNRLYQEILSAALDYNNDEMKEVFEEKFLKDPSRILAEHSGYYNGIPEGLIVGFRTNVGGGSYGHIEALGKPYWKPYETKDEYFESISLLEKRAKEIRIPDNLKDFMLEMGLSSREDLSESLFYLYKGVSGDRMRTRARYAPENKTDIVHPIKSSVKLGFILHAGRTYIAYNTSGFEDTRRDGYSGSFEERNEITYWPSDPEEILPDDTRKESYLDSFIDRSIRTRRTVNDIYDRTNKQILSSAFKYLDKKVDEYIEKKFESKSGAFKAYQLSDQEIEDFKIDYATKVKEKLSERREYYPMYMDLKNLWPSALSTLLLGPDPDRFGSSGSYDENFVNFFRDKVKNYVKEKEPTSEREVSFSVMEAFSKIDQSIAAEIDAGNGHSYLKGLHLFDNLEEDYKLNREVEFIKIIDIKDLSPIENEAIQAMESEDDFVLSDPMIKKLIIGTRFEKEKITGFRNFKKYIAGKAFDKPLTFTFQDDDDSYHLSEYYVNKEGVEYSERFNNFVKKCFKLSNKKEVLNKKLTDALMSGEVKPEDIREMELYKELRDISKKITELKIEGNLFYTTDSKEKYKAFEDFFSKTILKMYREEEAFLTGRKDQQFDESQRIAETLGINNLQKFLMSNKGGLSLPSILFEEINNDPDIVKLYIAVSSPDEFNSIERMHAFLLKITKFIKERANRDDSREYSLHYFQRYNFDDILSRLSGTKNEKIEKILSIVNLIDNNGKIQEEIANSKYLDKIDLDIFQKVVDMYNTIATYNSSESGDMVDEFNKARGAIEKNFGQERTEEILPIRLHSILEAISNVGSMDEFIDHFNIDFVNLSGEGFERSKELVAFLSYGIQIIRQTETLTRYYSRAQPKNKNLFKADMVTPTFRFRTLKDLDPYHFQIGIDTDCCQRIGGQGEQAAVDSFINPLAGVVALDVKKYDEWVIVAQSYFHYVPKDNSIILDNIESIESNKNVKKITGYTFPEIYLALGRHLQSQGIEEVLVGKDYTTVISKKDFNRDTKKKDPRDFSVRNPYSDYSARNSYNLLDANFDLEEMPKILPNTTTASLLSMIIKIAAINEISKNVSSKKLSKLAGALISRSLEKEALFLDQFIK